MNTLPLLASLDAGIDLKALVIYLLIMAVICAAAWFAKRAPVPFNYFAWVVITLAAAYLTIRFIQGL